MELRQPTRLRFPIIHDQINRVDIYHHKEFEEIPESSHDNNDKINAYLNTISKVIFQKWEVFLTIVIKNKFIFDIVALIDSDAALNCLQKVLYLLNSMRKPSKLFSEPMAKDLPLVTSCQMPTFVIRIFV